MKLTGNYLVGPNGFCKHDGCNPVKNMYTIHWFPGVGLCSQKVVDSRTIFYKVRFSRLAKAILRFKMRKKL